MKERIKIRYYEEFKKLFGWKLVGTRSYRSGRKHHTEYTWERDLNLDKLQLQKLNELESRYDLLDSSTDYLPSADIEIAILLFLLMIIPGILYLVYINNQKRKAKIEQENARREMKEIIEQVNSMIGNN